MKYIHEYEHDKNMVPLTIPEKIVEGSNVYTVIVGKNGVGKSRLLSDMAKTFTRKHEVWNNSYPYHEEYERDLGPRVIAASTSPFDKFSLPKRITRNSSPYRTNYRYLGMRSNNQFNLSAISLISSATNGILERFVRSNEYDKIKEVFRVLECSPEIKLFLKPNFKDNRFKSIDMHSERVSLPTSNMQISNEIDKVNFENKLTNNFSAYDSPLITTPKYIEPTPNWLEEEMGIVMEGRASIIIEDYSDQRKHELIDALNLYMNNPSEKVLSSITLDFENGNACGAYESHYDKNIVNAISILLKANLIKLMDLKLNKIEYGEMSLRRASSGEQCLMVLMLGIAGHIEDGALVFIDEPEISLHPKWQETFMTLLSSVFSNYKNCQFVIATHSPQIVSKLNNDNCFVTSLSQKRIYPASYFNNRSSDYQLAKLFDAPGSMNEYISRLAFGLLANIKSNKSVDSNDEGELKKLLGYLDIIDNDDPIVELIKSVEGVCEFYASN